MIEICCERNYLANWEKEKYAKEIRVIIKQLKKFQEAIKEKGIEVDCLIIME